MTKLEIVLPSASISRFTTLLQSGIRFPVTTGESIGDSLLRLPGLSNTYLTDKLQTIFLNGNPVDDLTTPFTDTDSTLALSAAMPGLAGAIFRRNSPHASLRGNYADRSQGTHKKPITISLKLFNTVAKDLGPNFLIEGVVIDGTTLHDFLSKRPQLLNSFNIIRMDGTPCLQLDLLPLIVNHSALHLILKEHHDTKA